VRWELQPPTDSTRLETALASPIVHSFQLIGQAAGDAALFVTGVILSAQSVLFSRNVISGAILKNVVHPLIGPPSFWSCR